MSLRDELLEAAGPQPRGYTLLVPPSWGRFAADATGRAEFERVVRSRMRAMGRPDIDARLRSLIRQQWQRMTSQRAHAVYLPIELTIEGATPISIVIVPWAARGRALEEDLRDRVDAEIERVETDIGPVLRWVVETSGAPGVEDAFAREINYLFPFPHAVARRGALLRAAVAHPGVEQGGEALEGFTDLVHGIAGTFRWRM